MPAHCWPEDGLTHLRHDRAGELRAELSSLTVAGGVIATFAPDDAADARIDARGCAIVAGSVDCHTHFPFAGWPAEQYEMKVTGDRPGGWRHPRLGRALAAATDDGVVAQASALAGEVLVHGTTAFECKCGRGGRAARSRSPSGSMRRSPSRPPPPPCSPTRCRTASPPTAGWTRSRGSCRGCPPRRE